MSAPREDVSQAQAELFKAETTWFHIFRNMVANDDMAKMRPQAFAVYCVIKAHANFATGQAFPGIELIAEQTGISVPQVKRELVTLEKMAYLKKEKRGRSNHYQLREKVEIQDIEGTPHAMASWNYVPNGVQAAVAEIKNALATGELGNGRLINIERFVINVNVHAGNGPQVNLNAEIKDPELRRQMESLLTKVRNQ